MTDSPMITTKSVEAGKAAIHSGHGCTCRRGAKGDAIDVVRAFLTAQDHDALAEVVKARLVPGSSAWVGARQVIGALLPVVTDGSGTPPPLASMRPAAGTPDRDPT
jgi:hypothetical protein